MYQRETKQTNEFRNDVAKKGLVQTIKDNRAAKAEAEREEALQNLM